MARVNIANDFEAKIRAAVRPKMEQTARRMETVITDLTARHPGADADTMKKRLVSEFARHGWTITDPELSRIANAAANGERVNVRYSP